MSMIVLLVFGSAKRLQATYYYNRCDTLGEPEGKEWLLRIHYARILDRSYGECCICALSMLVRSHLNRTSQQKVEDSSGWEAVWQLAPVPAATLSSDYP